MKPIRIKPCDHRSGRRRDGFVVAGPLVALIAAALAVVAPASTAHAQAPTVEVVSLSAEPGQPAQIVATVLDEAGASAPDLTADNFGVAINGNTVPVTSVTQGVDSTQGIAVVLAIDVSGSMAGVPLDQAKAAARSFVDGLAPQDEVAIVTFSETARTLLDFTTDRAGIGAAISGLQAGGPTALYNATADSARLIATSESERRAVILLSDGGIGVPTNTITRDDALAAVTPLGVPVFTIGLGSEIDREYLQQLADISGGQLTEAPSPEVLALAYERVGEVLRGQYVVELDAGDLTLDPSEPVTVRLSVDSSGLIGSAERTFAPAEPAIQIIGLPEGGRITEPTTLTAQVFATNPVVGVKFFLNDELVHESSTAPYEFSIDPAELSGGQDLRVEAEIAFAEPIVEKTDLQIGAAGGLLSGLMLPAVAIVLGAILIVGFVLWRRRKARPQRPGPQAARVLPSTPVRFYGTERIPAVPTPGPRLAPDKVATPQPAAIDEAGGWLVAFAGPISGQRFTVSGQPVSIGSSSRCAVRLPERSSTGEEIPSELARAWVRDGQLMVHFLLRLTATGPVGGGWSILGHGESFTIGPCAFRFEQANAPAVVQMEEEPLQPRSALDPINPSDVESRLILQPKAPAQVAPAPGPEPAVPLDVEPAPAPALKPAVPLDVEPPPPLEPIASPPVEAAAEPKEPSDLPNIWKDRTADGQPIEHPAGDVQDAPAQPEPAPGPLDADLPPAEPGPWDETSEERRAG